MPNFADRYPVGGGSLGTIGTLLSQGLPNITGFVKYIGASLGGNSCSGAFSNASFSNGTQSGMGGGLGQSHLVDTTFDAFRSSTIYGSANRVQPYSAIVWFCIRY